MAINRRDHDQRARNIGTTTMYCRVFSQKIFFQKSLDLSKDIESIGLILVKSVILWKNSFPESSYKRSKVSSCRKTGAYWRDPSSGTGRPAAEITWPNFSMRRCTCAAALYHHRGARAYACIHTPATEKGEARTCPRSAWQAREETHTHAPSSEFLIVIGSSTSLTSPKSSQQQRDLGIEITAAFNAVQHKNKKRCSARWNEGKVDTVLYRIVVVDSKNARFQSVLRRNLGEKNVWKQTPCRQSTFEVGASRMWYQTKAWGKTYQTTVVVWLPGEHTKRHGLRKWCHRLVPFAGYAHYAQSFRPISALQWRHWTPYM